MPIIEAKGLFGGKRLRKCSDGVRLRWPHYFLASNGFARFKLDPEDMLARAFPEMRAAVSIETFWLDMAEYRDNFLLFVWEAGGLWGQWDCPERCLSKYKTRADRESPTPDAGEFEKWRLDYQRLGSIPESFSKLRKFSPNSPLGIGVVVGIGVVEECSGVVKKPTPPTPSIAPLTAAEWAQPDIHEVAARLARELAALHWCPSEIPQAEAVMIRELVKAVDGVLAWETATRRDHVLWREAVAEARLDGSLPQSIANKRLAYWISDGFYLQKPKFGPKAGKPLADDSMLQRIMAKMSQENL